LRLTRGAYADTSFLVSLYGRDALSRQAQAMASSLSSPLLFTPFLRHESRNAVRLAWFRKDITAGESHAILAALEADVESGALAQMPLPMDDVFAEAEALSAAHTGKLGIRASGILHVASAVVLGAKTFYTFDVRHKALAAKAGMKVKP
jgi:predicted nucleic acid-binding protein